MTPREAAPPPAPLDAAIAALEEEFAFLGDWEERYGHILALGRAAERLEPHERAEENRVRGCASQVWLVSSRLADGRLSFRGESDSLLVQGLVALVVDLFDGRTPAEVLSVSPEDLLRRLGLLEALTPQRSNGLAALLARMRRDAQHAEGP